MSETICKGCGGVIDTTGLDPFIICECSDCGAELVIPFELDYLQLNKVLGRVSCLDIYEGFDNSKTTPCIVDVIDNEVEFYDIYLDWAKKDAKNLQRELKSPHISPIFDADEVLGNFCVISPLIDGYNLSDYNPALHGFLDIGHVVDVLQAAALGMAIAHNKDIIHHNVCLDNIRIDARGNVRITNFFRSRFTYLVDQKTNKSADEIKCDPSVSPYFLSPEKAESGIEDKRGDIFSFGVTMYYMLTGHYPFSGSTPLETVYSRVKKSRKKRDQEIFSELQASLVTSDTVDYVPPARPKSYRPEIPDSIDALVMSMLSYLPVKRPKFTEILAEINLLKAEKEKKQTVVAAQKVMVTTKTRAIPKMGNLSGKGKKKRKKRI